MPRQRTAPAVGKHRKQIGKRLRRIREEIAPDGTWGRRREVEAWLGVQLPTWYGYERGKAIPGDILLRLIVELGISPTWLLNGQGEIWSSERSRTADDDAEHKK
jgi:hypothetical protein